MAHARTRARAATTLGAVLLLAVSAVGGASGASGKEPGSERSWRDASVVDPATPFVPGEVLVRFRGGVTKEQRAAALDAYGAAPARELRLPGVVLARLAPGKGVAAAVQALSARPDVVYAEPNWIYRKTATPNDPRYGELWGLHQASDVDIDAPEAWDVTVGSSDVTVAVVDTGVAYDHPDLAPNMWTNPGEVPGDGIDNDGNGRVDDVRGWDFIDGDNDPRDFDGHGTHVGGTIGARGNNALGVVGVNWNVKLMAVRVLGPNGGTNETVANGFAYAAQMGAKVINASLGGSGYSQTMKDVIDGAPGSLFVVAAGNNGTNNESLPKYPCNYTSANLICVAATTRTDGLASFSNHGTTSVDLGAPGTEILSTWLAHDSLFSDGFETALGWTAVGTPASWARTTETAAAGSWSATDSPGGPYVSNARAYFHAPVTFNLSGRKGCSVRYLMKLQTEAGYDGFFVDASTNGTSWAEVAGYSGITTGYPSTWWSIEDSLSGFDGAPSVHLRLGLESDGTINLEGAHVDNLEVRCVSTNYTSASYHSIQGTSMATPHVAGVAALAWAKNPAATVSQVRTAILTGGDSIPSLAGKTVTGRRLNAAGTLALIPAPANPALTVAKSGTGFGKVTGTGIDCGTDCGESFAPGTEVVLTAAASPGSVFSGWSGCTSSAGTSCTVAMTTPKTVTATFTATPTFADVPPTNPFYTYVEHLYQLGITTGCGTNSGGQLIFCPGDFVPRQQMAAFLIRAKGLSQLNPATPTFADVPTTNPFYGYIEALYAAGITTGCGTNSGGQRIYCPGEFVPRQQMAAFLIRAFAG